MGRTRGGTARDTVRQLVVAVSAVIAIVGSFIGSGAAGGIPIQDAAGGALAADATRIAPGGPAFAIWGVIYVGLLAYAVWQLLPAQRTAARQRTLGYPIALSLLLNAVWILSVQYGQLAFSVVVIVLLLVDLAWTFRLTLLSRPSSLWDAVVTDGTVGLYLGWVCVATAANVTAAVVAAGFRGSAPDVWAVAVLVVAGLVGVLLAVGGRGRIAPMLSLCWGLVWVAVARFGGPLFSVPAAVAALAAAGIVAAVTIALRIRRT